MKDTNLDELIDAYLKNKLTVEQRIHLDRQMLLDPELHKRVKESEITYGYLQYIHYEKIRDQMRAYDHSNPTTNPGENKVINRKEIIFILLILLSTILYLCFHFSPENIARRNIMINNSRGVEMSTENEDFVRATNLFQKERYEAAKLLFNQIATKRIDDHIQIATWNALMCELAQHGFSDEVTQRLNGFTRIPTLRLDQRSEKILSLSRSRIVRWMVNPVGKNIPQIRPRLM